jgi:hypothetical protein
MTTRFTARAVGVDTDPESECLTAGVAENEDGDGMALMFMCSLDEPDEDDAELGEDTHCVVTADQATAYGAVEKIALRGKVLHVRLTADGADELGVDDRDIEALLDVEDNTIEQFRIALQRVLTYGRPDARPAEINL